MKKKKSQNAKSANTVTAVIQAEATEDTAVAIARTRQSAKRRKGRIRKRKIRRGKIKNQNLQRKTKRRKTKTRREREAVVEVEAKTHLTRKKVECAKLRL